jgi:hypothetical protein
MAQCPQIEVRGLTNGDKVRGIGEPPVPPRRACACERDLRCYGAKGAQDAVLERR